MEQQAHLLASCCRECQTVLQCRIDETYVVLQMPRGVPVATVAIGNAANAGLLAVRILATSNPQLQAEMMNYQVWGCYSTISEVASLMTGPVALRLILQHLPPSNLAC